MPDTYTVRLEDGSEIGPLDLSAVREWYARGLIHADSPVLSPGSPRWVPLRHLRGVQATAGPRSAPARPAARAMPPRPPAARPVARPAPPRAETRSPRQLVAFSASLVFLVAGGAVWWGTRANLAPTTDEAPPASGAPADAAAARLADERRAEAVRRAVEAVPHLTPRSAGELMSRSQAEVLLPEETFRRSQVALRRGLASFSAAETRDLGRLTSAVHARLAGRDRSRLAGYLARLKDGRATTADDDRAMAQAVRAAELRLASRDLERLRALYEKATLAAP